MKRGTTTIKQYHNWCIRNNRGSNRHWSTKNYKNSVNIAIEGKTYEAPNIIYDLHILLSKFMFLISWRCSIFCLITSLYTSSAYLHLSLNPSLPTSHTFLLGHLHISHSHTQPRFPRLVHQIRRILLPFILINLNRVQIK